MQPFDIEDVMLPLIAEEKFEEALTLAKEHDAIIVFISGMIVEGHIGELLEFAQRDDQIRPEYIIQALSLAGHISREALYERVTSAEDRQADQEIYRTYKTDKVEEAIFRMLKFNEVGKALEFARRNRVTTAQTAHLLILTGHFEKAMEYQREHFPKDIQPIVYALAIIGNIEKAIELYQTHEYHFEDQKTALFEIVTGLVQTDHFKTEEKALACLDRITSDEIKREMLEMIIHVRDTKDEEIVDQLPNPEMLEQEPRITDYLFEGLSLNLLDLLKKIQSLRAIKSYISELLFMPVWIKNVGLRNFFNASFQSIFNVLHKDIFFTIAEYTCKADEKTLFNLYHHRHTNMRAARKSSELNIQPGIKLQS